MPIALPDPEPFSVESMASLRTGETTREEVLALLSAWTYETDDGIQTAHLEPHAAAADGRYWVFALSRERADVLWVGLALMPEAGVPVPFAVGKGENIEDFWAVFEFGDDDTVVQYWIAGDRTPCAAGGACYHGNHLQIMAGEADHVGARAGAATDACVVYAYARDDFELPVTVADGKRDGRLFAQTSFVRFDLAPGAAPPAAWYANAPGSRVTMPVGCASGEAHYVALQPKGSAIEAVPQKPPIGERAVAKRYVVERLVPVTPGQALDVPPRIWTNCTAADPCLELATVDALPGTSSVDVAIVDEQGVFPTPADHLLLCPGRYTVRSGTQEYPKRLDTFEIKAGHRYEMRHRSMSCPGAPKHREARAGICRGTPGSADSHWFEDAATMRVVAGDKWCASDADCPESQCSAQADAPRTCAIPELHCKYGERCEPR